MLLIFAISAALFIGIAVAILLDRTSYTRLILHSIAVWIVMVLQLYALFMVNIHRRASDQVQWNLSNSDTFGTEESVLISEVS